MSPQPKPDPFDQDDLSDTRAHSLWPDTLRGYSEFAPARFGPAAEAREAERARVANALEVVRPARALRLALALQAAAGLGVALSAPAAQAAQWWVSACAVAALGCALWLVAVAASRGALREWRWPLVAAVLGVAGAVAAPVAALAVQLARDAEPMSPWRALALVATGALAAVLAAAWYARRGSTPWGGERARREAHAGLAPAFAADAVAAARALVRGDPVRAEAVLDDLGLLLQAQGGPAARLADEMDLAQRYLGIEQLRFGARLRAAVELDPAAASAWLPALALAVLASHAAREAVEASEDGGEVTLRVHARADRAVVLISHTVGDDEDAVAADAATEALEGVRERLRLLHGADALCEGWREGAARHVRLTLPR